MATSEDLSLEYLFAAAVYQSPRLYVQLDSFRIASHIHNRTLSPVTSGSCSGLHQVGYSWIGTLGKCWRLLSLYLLGSAKTASLCDMMPPR